MNNILDIKSPAQKEALVQKAFLGLDLIGLTNVHQAYWNLPVEALYEEIVFRREAQISYQGPIIVNTGKHTARSANDKFVVKEDTTGAHVWWGEYNRPFNPDKFNEVYDRLMGFLQGRDVFVQDCYAGADPNYRLPVRVITELAWHSLFARTMLIPCATREEYQRFVPDFTVISVPSFKGMPSIDMTPGATFILLNFEQKVCIIGNTAYAGEIKKSVFSIMNYLHADAGRDVHALLGQHRQVRRHRRLLRAFGHGQNDPFGRPQPLPHRRRRARLVGRRHFQLRERLLRQGHRPFRDGGTGNLRLHAKIRLGAGKCGL